MTENNGELKEYEEAAGFPNVTNGLVNENSAEYPLENITFNVTENQNFLNFAEEMRNYTLGQDSESDIKLCRLNELLSSFYNFLSVANILNRS